MDYVWTVCRIYLDVASQIASVYYANMIYKYMSCHQDGGDSQGGTGHSLPLARRRGSFNFDYQLNSSTER